MDRLMEIPIPVDLGRIAQDLQIRRVQVESVVQLLDEGNTVPFITRYRKERTGNLNELVIREIQARVGRLRELAERKETILKSIEQQGKLSDELREAIRSADNPKRLEDLYLPYKPKKKTKASDAREKGLEPLALRIWTRDESLTDLIAAAQEFVSPEKGLESPEQVLEGVGHILSESINELAEVRDAVRRAVWKTGRLLTTKAEGVPDGQGLDFRDYFNYSEPVSHVPPHRVLAINRGDKENVLKVKLDVPHAEMERALFSQLPLEGHPHQEFFSKAALDALDRLLLPSLEREIRRDLTDAAERHAVDVFARNLRSLILQPPITKQTVLAIDPGFRTGCKLAVLDPLGNLLAHDVIHPHQPQNRRSEAKLKIKDLVGKHHVGVVAIGNGTACRETEELVAEVIAEGTFFHENPDATSMPGRGTPPETPARPPTELPEQKPDETPAEVPPETPAEPSPDEIPDQPPPEAPDRTEPSPADAPPPEAEVADAPSEIESQQVPPRGETPEATAEGETAPEESPPPIMGGAPEGEDETGQTAADSPAGETPIETVPPPPSSAPEAHSAEAEGQKADLLESSEPTRNPAHEGEATPSQPGVAAATVEPTAEAPPPEPTAEAPPPEPTAGATTEEEQARPPAPDFTHLPVGPKPKAQEPRPPRPPKVKQPPQPPRPHAADALLSGLSYVIVNEAGASVYSTSPVGREEFADLDATTRSAISIGRRLQDPLAELVKIEPQNIGVGLYQHDVNPKQLKDSLETVIESCVNFVGVDLNTASVSLLRHVSGLNALTARRLFDYRKEHGAFTSREQITQVEGIGPATFTQAAGFLKIREDAHPLDRTWVHPESYTAATKLLERLGFSFDVVLHKDQLPRLIEKLDQVNWTDMARELEVGEPTLRDIADALARPDRDPRDDLPKPIFKKGVLKLEDLSAGMELKGTVLNVVDFGAFVDIGLKDSGLVHISQLANRYIKSPHDVVSVGDVVTVWVMGVDPERKRVSLTMVQPGSERPRGPGGERRRGGPGGERGDRRGGGPRREGASSVEGGPAPSDREARGGEPRPGARLEGPPRGSRIPGPPQRSQSRGGPGRGGPGGSRRFERAADRPPAGDRPPPRPPKPAPPPPPLSKEALQGNAPLRTFGQLKQLFEARTKGPDEEETPEAAPGAESLPAAETPPPSPPSDSESPVVPDQSAK
jgi:uncharacterized protein